MNQQSCLVCNTAITKENDSLEHVIPNSIGGILKIPGFICRQCNNNAGETWDASLSRQLNPLSLLFGIVRDRGAVPSQEIKTTLGETLVLHNDGSLSPAKPTYKETHVESAVTIELKARSEKEAARMLAGVKRKYPKANIDELLAGAVNVSTYPQGMLKFELCFGGQEAGKSIVKSVLALAKLHGVPPAACEMAISYIRDENQKPPFGYFYQADPVVARPDGIPLHCISIKSNISEKILWGYLEYFGCQRVIVCLSENYQGPEISCVHAINPTLGAGLQLDVNIDLKREDIEPLYDYRFIPSGAVEKAFADVLSKKLQDQNAAERNRVIHDSVEYAFANCGAVEGEILTEEHVEKMTKLMMEKLTPFLLHSLKRKGRDE